MDTTAWKKQASLIVFCIVFIGCLSEVSIAKEEAVKLDDVFLMDIVTPILGIETVGGVMTNLIPKNTFIPAKKSHVFTTYQDQQTTVSIKVYEGRHNLTKDCKLLGTFDLSGIQPAPRGTPEIEVTFELVAHDILHVKAEDKASGKSEYITIKNIGSLSNEEIDRMIRQAEEFAEEDRRAGEGIDVIYTLKTYIYKIRNQIKDKLANKLAQIKDKLAKEIGDK